MRCYDLFSLTQRKYIAYDGCQLFHCASGKPVNDTTIAAGMLMVISMGKIKFPGAWIRPYLNSVEAL